MPIKSALSAAAIAVALVYPAVHPTPAAAQVPPDLVNPQVEVDYIAPTTERFVAVANRVKQSRVLERLRIFLTPLKLPRKLVVTVAECGAVTRAFKPGGPATICYELIEQIERIAVSAPPETRQRVLVGAFIQAAFHEVSYALFDILRVPVWGRAYDAADRLSAFVMIQFSEDVALQTILGTADFFKLSGKTWTGNAFAAANSPEAQRFYNYLCVALGGAPKSFDFLVNPRENEERLLPEARAERCAGEYEQVRMAFDLRIMPYIDPDLLVRVRSIQWLRPDEAQ
jgi:hypothetical protein